MRTFAREEGRDGARGLAGEIPELAKPEVSQVVNKVELVPHLGPAIKTAPLLGV